MSSSPPTPGQRERGGVRPVDLAGGRGDVLERVLVVDALQQHRRDVLTGPQPVLAPLRRRRTAARSRRRPRPPRRATPRRPRPPAVKPPGFSDRYSWPKTRAADADGGARGTSPWTGGRAGSRGTRGARAGRARRSAPVSGISPSDAERERRRRAARRRPRSGHAGGHEGGGHARGRRRTLIAPYGRSGELGADLRRTARAPRAARARSRPRGSASSRSSARRRRRARRSRLARPRVRSPVRRSRALAPSASR